MRRRQLSSAQRSYLLCSNYEHKISVSSGWRPFDTNMEDHLQYPMLVHMLSYVRANDFLETDVP